MTFWFVFWEFYNSTVHAFLHIFSFYIRAHLHATPDFMRKFEKKEERRFEIPKSTFTQFVHFSNFQGFWCFFFLFNFSQKIWLKNLKMLLIFMIDELLGLKLKILWFSFFCTKKKLKKIGFSIVKNGSSENGF
jgi:hypothetical protein